LCELNGPSDKASPSRCRNTVEGYSGVGEPKIHATTSATSAFLCRLCFLCPHGDRVVIRDRPSLTPSSTSWCMCRITNVKPDTFRKSLVFRSSRLSTCFLIYARITIPREAKSGSKLGSWYQTRGPHVGLDSSISMRRASMLCIYFICFIDFTSDLYLLLPVQLLMSRACPVHLQADCPRFHQRFHRVSLGVLPKNRLEQGLDSSKQ
jgi:hypothetical protein